MPTLVLALSGWLFVIGFLVWLLSYCLRVGAIGSFWVGDASRSETPIRFWTAIVGLMIAVLMMMWVFIYAVWKIFLR